MDFDTSNLIIKIQTNCKEYSIPYNYHRTTLLHYATGYFLFETKTYGKVISVIIGCCLFFIFDFIPVFGIDFGHISFWFLIKYIYNVGWDRTAAAWFMSIFIAFFNIFCKRFKSPPFKAIFHVEISGLRSPGINAWEDVTVTKKQKTKLKLKKSIN